MRKESFFKMKDTKAIKVYNKLAAYDTSLKDYWDYGKNLVSHKVDVYTSGKQIDVPRKKLLTHDIDKFFPKRFKIYAEWFYGPQGVRGTKNSELKKKWRESVEEHYKRSPHHANKLGKKKDLYTELESLADQYSAIKRSSNKKTFIPFKGWLTKNINNFNISDSAHKKVVQHIS